MPRTPPRPSLEQEVAGVAAFRTELRRFLRRTKTVTNDAGLTPERYDLLLMIHAAGADGGEVRLSDLCEALQLRQTAVSELVKRADEAGLLEKRPATGDGRGVALRLSAEGERRLLRSVEALRDDRDALRASFDEAGARLRDLGGR